MPISAERMKLYLGGSIRSPEWLALRGSILGRAEYRCEGTPQHPECRAVNGEKHPETGSKVVLTIAHMDQDPGNNDNGNLRALCQRCHLAWDRPHHLVSASITRKLRVGQPDLFAQPDTAPEATA